MAKISPNAPCPCGSGIKYTKCCGVFHKGARPKSALELMKSRYSAYAAGNSSYIISTTHPDNPEWDDDLNRWEESIGEFSRQNDFLGLNIIEFVDGDEEAYVTFEALLSSGTLREKSRFIKLDDKWLYVDGTEQAL